MKRPPVPPPTLRLPRARRSPLAAAGSLVGHVILLLLVFGVARAGQPLVQQDGEDYLSPDGGGGGGGGGQQVALLALPAPEVPEAKPVPVVERTEVPQPVVTPPPVEMPTEIPPLTLEDPPAPLDTIPRTADSAATGGGPGTGGGVGTGAGTGTGPGVGPGSGPGSGGGTGGLARPPEPRQMILPPFDYPRTMRGRTIAVTFFVEDDGRVARVTFAPEVPDRGFAKKLEDVMRAYRFRPARSAEGGPIPGTTTVSVTF